MKKFNGVKKLDGEYYGIKTNGECEDCVAYLDDVMCPYLASMIGLCDKGCYKLISKDRAIELGFKE